MLEQPRLHDGRGVLRQDTALLPPYPAVILLFARRGGQGGCGGRGAISASCHELVSSGHAGGGRGLCLIDGFVMFVLRSLCQYSDYMI